MFAATPSGPTGPSALVQFQLGLFREVVRVPAGNRTYRHAKRLAAEIIERKVRGLLPRRCFLMMGEAPFLLDPPPLILIHLI